MFYTISNNTINDFFQDLNSVFKPSSNFSNGKSYKTAINGDSFSGREEIIGNITTTRSFEDMMGKPTEGYWIRNEEWFFKWNITENHIGLFDMKIDQNNDMNLANEKPEMVSKMRERIKEWKEEINGLR